MGYRFRKSFKAGPLKMTLSKSGISTSVGVKGARITKKANGKVSTTFSIPNTGISYTNEKNNKKKNSNTTSQSSNFTSEDSKHVLALFCALLCFPMIVLGFLLSLVEPVIGFFGIIIGFMEFNYSKKYFNNKEKK